MRCSARHLCCIFACLSICFGPGCGGGSSENGLSDLSQLVERVEPAVVRINVSRDGKEIGQGSGFVLTANGLVATNHHVIEAADSAEVVFPDGRSLEVTGIASLDSALDIAILKIESEKPLAAVELASDLPKKGSFALALGAPKGLSFTATDGIVSAIRNTDEMSELGADVEAGTWIPTSASITSGNSGGPLFDSDGNLIGMNTMILTNSGNIGFAVWAADVAQVLAEAKTVTEFVSLDSQDPTQLEPESAPEISPELANRVSELAKKIELAKNTRIADLNAKRSQLQAIERSIREAKIQADDTVLKDERVKYQTVQNQLHQLLNRPLDLPTLDITNLHTLEFGRFPSDRVFKIVQVWDSTTGALLLMDERSFGTIVVKGLDATDAVDGKSIRMGQNLVFLVLGTYTYETVSGASKTIFVLETSSDDQIEIEDSEYREIAKAGIPDPELTVDEQGLAVANKNKRLMEAQKAKELAQKQAEAEMAFANAARLAKEEQDRKAAEEMKLQEQVKLEEAKNNRAASRLEMARKFIIKENLSSARRYLKEVIEEVPGTETAKEAERLLKKIGK